MKKRILSFALAASMVVSMLPWSSLSAAAEESNPNLAFGRPVLNHDEINSDDWRARNLVDGITTSMDGNNGYSTNNTRDANDINNTDAFTIDFGADTTFNKVVLYPRTNAVKFETENGAVNFPRNFEVQASDDVNFGEGTYDVLLKKEGVETTVDQPLTFTFESATKRYLRFCTTRVGYDENGTGSGRVQLAEFEVYNEETPEPEAKRQYGLNATYYQTVGFDQGSRVLCERLNDAVPGLTWDENNHGNGDGTDPVHDHNQAFDATIDALMDMTKEKGNSIPLTDFGKMCDFGAMGVEWDSVLTTASGDITVKEAGTYTFSARVDNGFLLELVDKETGEKIRAYEFWGIAAWGDSGKGMQYKPVELEAKTYTLNAYFLEFWGGECCDLTVRKDGGDLVSYKDYLTIEPGATVRPRCWYGFNGDWGRIADQLPQGGGEQSATVVNNKHYDESIEAVRAQVEKAGEIVVPSVTIENNDQLLFNSRKAGCKSNNAILVDYEGYITPLATGDYNFGLAAADNCMVVSIDHDFNGEYTRMIEYWGKATWYDDYKKGVIYDPDIAPVHLEAGKSYPFKATFLEIDGGKRLVLAAKSGEDEVRVDDGFVYTTEPYGADDFDRGIPTLGGVDKGAKVASYLNFKEDLPEGVINDKVVLDKETGMATFNGGDGDNASMLELPESVTKQINAAKTLIVETVVKTYASPGHGYIASIGTEPGKLAIAGLRENYGLKTQSTESEKQVVPYAQWVKVKWVFSIDDGVKIYANDRLVADNPTEKQDLGSIVGNFRIGRHTHPEWKDVGVNGKMTEFRVSTVEREIGINSVAVASGVVTSVNDADAKISVDLLTGARQKIAAVSAIGSAKAEVSEDQKKITVTSADGATSKEYTVEYNIVDKLTSNGTANIGDVYDAEKINGSGEVMSQANFVNLDKTATYRLTARVKVDLTEVAEDAPDNTMVVGNSPVIYKYNGGDGDNITFGEGDWCPAMYKYYLTGGIYTLGTIKKLTPDKDGYVNIDTIISGDTFGYADADTEYIKIQGRLEGLGNVNGMHYMSEEEGWDLGPVPENIKTADGIKVTFGGYELRLVKANPETAKTARTVSAPAVDAEKDEIYNSAEAIEPKLQEGGAFEADANYSNKTYTAYSGSTIYLFTEVVDSKVALKENAADFGDAKNGERIKYNFDFTNIIYDGALTEENKGKNIPGFKGLNLNTALATGDYHYDTPIEDASCNIKEIKDGAITYAYKLTENGYNVEIAVDTSKIVYNDDRTAELKPGQSIGLDVIVQDKQTVGGGANKYSWDGTDYSWDFPAYNGTLLLQKDSVYPSKPGIVQTINMGTDYPQGGDNFYDLKFTDVAPGVYKIAYYVSNVEIKENWQTRISPIIKGSGVGDRRCWIDVRYGPWDGHSPNTIKEAIENNGLSNNIIFAGVINVPEGYDTVVPGAFTEANLFGKLDKIVLATGSHDFINDEYDWTVEKPNTNDFGEDPNGLLKVAEGDWTHSTRKPVEPGKSNNANVTKVTVNGVEAAAKDKSFTVRIPKSDNRDIKVDLEDANATYTLTQNPILNSIWWIDVTAEDGTTKQRYTVMISEFSSDTALKSVKVDGVEATLNGSTYKVTVDKADTHTVELELNVVFGKAVVSDDLTKITVTAEDGTVKEYALEITERGSEPVKSNNTNITEVKVDGVAATRDGDEFAAEVDKANGHSVEVTLEDAKASAVISDDLTKITVTAEDGTVKVYTLKITERGSEPVKSNNTNITEVKVDGVAATRTDDKFAAEVNKANGHSVEVTLEDAKANAVISDDLKTITVTAEDGTVKVYTLTITEKTEVQKPADKTPVNGTAKNAAGKTVLYKNGKLVTGNVVVTIGKTSYAVKNSVVVTGKKRIVKIGKYKYAVSAKGKVYKAKSKAKLLRVKVGKRTYVVNNKGRVQLAKKGFKLVGKKVKYIVNKKGYVQIKKKNIKVGKKAYKTNKKGVAKRK